jgi:hypothetical protein
LDLLLFVPFHLSLLDMNYFREILDCGGSGRYAPLEKDGDGDMWRERFLCKGKPWLPAVPRIIRFDILQMLDETYENDDEEKLVGLAFVEDTKHQKTSSAAFTEMVDLDSVEESIEDVLLCTWSSFLSLSTDDEDDDSYNNWNKSPVRSFDDGSSYATESHKKISDLFFPVDEKQTKHVSSTIQLSQGTVPTVSSPRTSDPGLEYGEI